MSIKVRKSKPAGSLLVPPSKSQTMRALLFGAAGNGISRVDAFLKSADTERMIYALKMFGADFSLSGESLEIKGTGGEWRGADDVIDVGNSGIMLRFLAAIAVNAPGYTVLTGDASIRKMRNMQELLSGITQLGGEAVSTRANGLAPVVIRGPLTNRRAKIRGVDSQPVSSLMIAAALQRGIFRIDVDEMGEVPWVELTAAWLKKAGAKVSLQGSSITVEMHSSFNSFDYRIGGDISSAAFPAAAALISGTEVELKGLQKDDGQGDIRFFQIIETMGAKVVWSPCGTTLKVCPGDLCGIEIDINDCIDAIAALSVIACYSKGKTVIRNAEAARFKECDRIGVLASELKKMGARIQTIDDGLVIEGGPLQGAVVNSHHDHRMAMAFIAAGLGADGETYVQETSCIEKTYANFPEEMRRMGADLKCV
ncbi:3-phosphoshikimate 1-carboxyvinyltransferase [Estrella lausannensis]|uniref:3-phosphoshikimate 1-carboxyvinyltransferase n=1 Tax=Estrella lausannensis TaxID=483423 RepID=A0A0H5DTZ9_9BACT|nr:3-phosphoshikimate 1-carboxyvinyltransferase [Estrella lausannensis]CRX39374.1 3-phosphoshikimate 1-carboxyvinyltransferase [Estrella lausannensis]